MHLIAVVLGCQATSVCTADIEDAEQFDFLVQIGFCWSKHSYFFYTFYCLELVLGFYLKVSF